MKNDISSADIKKRIAFLVAGILLLALATIGFTNVHLYQVAIKEEGEILAYTAKSHAQVIESFARHEKEDALLFGPPSNIDDTVNKYRAMTPSFKAFGETGSFVIVRREGESIRWIVRHRKGAHNFPETIPFNSAGKTDPIRLALEGESGTVIGKDYRGVTVLAAYEPVPSLNLAIVAKLDLAEVRAPYIKHGIESFLAALLLVLGGGLIYVRTVTPMMPQLMAREETLRSILENASEGIITIDAAANILYANRAVERMFDYPADDLAGKPFAMLMSECAFSVPMLEEAMECQMLRRNGATFPAIISGRLWAEGTRRAFTLIVQDISERKEADDLLRASEEKYRGLVENALVGIVRSTLDGKMIYANNALIKMFEFDSLEEFISTAAPKMWKNPEDRKRMVENLKSSGHASFEAEMLTGTGKTITILFSAVLVDDAISASITDITDRKMYEHKLETANHELTAALEQVRQTQAVLMRSDKLAAVGTLSAGVAHEILNPLNIIGTIVQMMQMDEWPAKVKEHLEEIMMQVRRATKITDNLRQFAHQRRVERVPLDMHALFDKTAMLLEHQLQLDNIRIERDFDPGLQIIYADEDQMAQVFLNLMNNARDAMGDRRNGVITVKTRNLDNGVEIRFSDNGPGIPADIAGRIFDPFFTTKDPSKGTGLGLSMMHTIILEHKGTIDAESEEGKGAAFVIYLPVRSDARNKALQSGNEKDSNHG